MADANDSRPTRRHLLGTLAVVASAGCADLAPDQSYVTPETVRTRAPNETAQPTEMPPDGEFQRLYEAVASSVAAVRTAGSVGSCYAGGPDHLVTNHHVVDDADSVAVQYARDDWVRAEVVATDVYSDLAVLADPDRPDYVAPLPLVGYPPTVGQEVAAIGAPFGLRNTFTTGTISGVNRAVEAVTGVSVPGAIQTDAAVNPGNSGGPLVTLEGEIAGVVSAGGGENIGFGIPPQLVRRVVPDLIEFGDYQHPFLGLTLQEVTPAVAAANGLDAARGLVVVDTVGNGPVDGVLRPSTGRRVVNGEQIPVGGDVLLALGDGRLGSVADLSTELAFERFPGDEVAIQFRRDGTVRTVTVTIGVRPPRP
jgi:S1-C subfamily serine protease